jgi:hypothetical protein
MRQQAQHRAAAADIDIVAMRANAQNLQLLGRGEFL